VKFIGSGRGPKSLKRRVITIQIDESILNEIDKLARVKNIARQRLIKLILKSALSNPDFTVDLSEEE
jgi:metal-responsive CopG/Arc/MetJ family transcriptional regulator